MFNKNRDSHGKNATLTFQHLCCLILIFTKPSDISNPENNTDVTPNVNHKFEGCSFNQGRTTVACNIKIRLVIHRVEGFCLEGFGFDYFS